MIQHFSQKLYFHLITLVLKGILSYLESNLLPPQISTDTMERNHATGGGVFG